MIERRRRMLRGRRGEIDSRDLIIGIVLALVLPFVAVVLERIFEPREQADPFAKGKAPTFNIAPTQDEVEDRVRYVQDLYAGNAQKYLKYAQEGADQNLRYYMVRWTKRTLQKAKEKAKEAEEFIQDKAHPEAAGQFADYLARLGALKKQMDDD